MPRLVVPNPGQTPVHKASRHGGVPDFGLHTPISSQQPMGCHQQELVHGVSEGGLCLQQWSSVLRLVVPNPVSIF